MFVQNLKQLKASRSSKLGALTRRKNEIKQLLEYICNVELLKCKMETEFFKLCTEVEEWNDTVQAFISIKDKEEMEKDKVE